MTKGYYWIPQTDETLNGRSYYVAKIVGDITFDTSYSGVKAPKELNKPLAYYLAAVANYFKEQVEKE